MKSHRRTFVVQAAVLLMSALTLPLASAAQPTSYPDKPVRFYIPYPPGAATDNLGRMAANVYAQDLGQSFVVENKGGGGTIIGTRALATSEPDGYSIGMVDTTFVINPGLRGADLPYDTLKDFAPISLMATAPFVLVVHPSVEATDLKAFVALAKSAPGTLSYGSAGIGSGPHLAGEQLRQEAGIDIQHVPYRGGGSVFTDLLGGQVQFAFGTVPTLLPHIQAGKLRALAVTSPNRVSTLQDVPTFAEAGLPGVDISPLFGVIAPAGVAPDTVEKLSTTLATSVKSGELNGKLVALGFDPVGSTPAEFQKRIADEVSKWREVIKRGGITAQ